MTDPRRPIDRNADTDPDPNVLPQDAPRGGVTVPASNDTGTTTPPISGWGERPVREDESPDDEGGGR